MGRLQVDIRLPMLVLLTVASLTACGNDSASRNKAVVRGYMEEVMNKGNLAAVEDYFGPEGFDLNGRLLTPDMLAVMRATLINAFPDFHLTIEDQIAEGDKVVTRVTFRGTHQGEFHGIAATGKRVTYTGIAIDRVEDGKVVEGWHQADELSLLQQLGVVPEIE